MSTTRAQSTASNPAISVWVAANAGTGKTKVLTDRVLRLLLAGSLPQRILCLTYTNAAAAEMKNRIHHALAEWVAMSDEHLYKQLNNLTGVETSAETLYRARCLFAHVLESPEGVRIQTVHGFCQSILRRFPLEAEVQPHFEVIDERTALELLGEAKQRLFQRALSADVKEKSLREAVHILSQRLAEKQLHDLLAEMIKNRRHLAPSLLQKNGAKKLIARVYEWLAVSFGEEADPVPAQLVERLPSEESSLRNAIIALETGTKTDVDRAQIIARFLERNVQERRIFWPEYCKAWLIASGEKAKNLATKTAQKASLSVEEYLRAEQDRVWKADQKLRAIRIAAMSAQAITIADGLFEIYNHLKSINDFLDYDDLTWKVRALLRKPGIAPWVLYKLDGGIDHVLIDEAQDTSPEQWELISLLVNEFFEADSRKMGERTLFVVGDEKQSIYSFQGAEPREFDIKKQSFGSKARDAGVEFVGVGLGLSFRSTQAVLDVVDGVFSQAHVKAGLSYADAEIRHSAHRNGQAGKVEIWPLTTSEKQEDFDGLKICQSYENKKDSKYLLAERIARSIADWLQQGAMLESRGRPIRAGDILVLVRKRNSFMNHLVRALQNMNVPVAGVDRLRITDHIAVMDMMALAEFLLLPEDDLTLACVLKNPLFNLSEEELFELAYGRGDVSLWERMRIYAGRSSNISNARKTLSELLAHADYIRPFELFAEILETRGGRRAFLARMGEEVLDPLEAFMELAINYERTHAPSLQGFLQWLRSGDVEIKRDMEQGQDAVRIMTVHGSKGLQAPIVFLPDTTDKPRFKPRPLWASHASESVMVWAPSTSEYNQQILELKELYQEREEEEYRRLLYVALTRAEDRLYIGGWQGKDKVSPDCWYHWVRTGMEAMPSEIRPAEAGYEGEIRVTACAQTEETVSDRRYAEIRPDVPLPVFFHTPPAPEPFPPQPLVPSRQDAEAITGTMMPEQAVVCSPVQDGRQFRRGIAIHTLLQYLPTVKPEKRADAARHYLTRFAEDELEAQHEIMVKEVLAVLEHPDLAPVFSEGSLAEVPITGLITDATGKIRLLSGQVDRLCVGENDVWVIDYKTQKLAPERVEDVPLPYLRQMAAYVKAIAEIYPQKQIHAALLWTSAPRLMHLPESLLASSLDSLG